MEIGNALAVAFGLAFLILGSLYLLFRGGQVAQQQRENPALPQPRVWLLVHYGFIAFVVATCLYGGTFFLISRFPNYFIAVGAAIWFYAQALRRGLGLRFLQAGLRGECLANVLAGSLCAVGSVFAWRAGRRPRRDWVAGLGHYLVVDLEDIWRL